MNILPIKAKKKKLKIQRVKYVILHTICIQTASWHQSKDCQYKEFVLSILEMLKPSSS